MGERGIFSFPNRDNTASSSLRMLYCQTPVQVDVLSEDDYQEDVILPLKEWGYDLNKQQFWDAIQIRYNWNHERLPTDCVCGEKFDFSHAPS